MKVFIDVTPISSHNTGVGFYIKNLLAELYQLQTISDLQLHLIYQPGMKNWIKRNWQFPELLHSYSSLSLLPLPVRLSNLYLETYPQGFSQYLEKQSHIQGIIHGTNYTVFPYPNCDKIITIYDLTCIRHPQFVNHTVKKYPQRIKKCLQWTDIIITISESTKQDIVNFLDINPDKIFVTSLASRFSNFQFSKDLEYLEKSINYNFEQPYLLFVSTLEPRKNIVNIIKAFNYLKEKHKIPHHLLLVGRKGWDYQAIFTAIHCSPWQQQIHHLDYVNNEQLALLYKQADLFVYPSHYEGFGLPVLEAMTFGVPVVTSNLSSLPEVAGDAALLVDPEDAIALAEAILKILNDSQLRESLSQKGRTRSQQFSWQKTAQQTLQVYQFLTNQNH
ncbi:glycosyltransferase family 1 protein [Spirulina sp. 06S082]|uniref:glycosyltransferase family 4 protein n=1 Tax=Spirulina sp. 06S082 TaxID=3110248 RepID=UPI002B20E1FB|nr:glycosyltransferase family 1 protein [Spirulina sp. 06S082]MEA5469952.1 glycosyltransferase family 1 protein [Spirulina sp. 06S082]